MEAIRDAINLWSPRGRLHREPYAVWGVALATVKLGIDAVVAHVLFGRRWTPEYYLMPDQYTGLLSLDLDERVFFGTLLLYSLPFAWIGLMLTIRRLRAAALPVELAALFFVPLINLLFFLALCLIPTRLTDEEPDEPLAPRLAEVVGASVPDSRGGAAVLAIFACGILGLGAAALGSEVMEFYGWGIFTALPFLLGLLSVLIYGYHGRRTYDECIAVALAGIAMVGGLMFVFALEGAICLLMASPIWGACTWLGATAGFAMQSVRPSSRAVMLLIFTSGLPLVVSVERPLQPAAPLHAVSTSIEVAADLQAVWDLVVAFPPIPEPEDWYFRMGVAYPTAATIEGEGVGAVRRCTFSTGSFIEPIEVWDEPRRLAFGVSANPPPLREWSVHEAVEPPHLSGFLQAERGQFVLVPLPGGGTRIEGTTWYRHHLWPAPYWSLWSDAIIHRIHGRVLRHIARHAEDANRGERLAHGMEGVTR